MSLAFPIDVDDRDITLTATAGQTVFPGDFPIQQEGDISVATRIVGGAWTPQTLNAHYSVADITALGFNVAFGAGRALNEEVRIRGLAPISRTSDFDVTGRRSRSAINYDLDRLIIHTQEARRDIAAQEASALDLAARAWLTPSGAPPAIGPTSDYFGKWLRVDGGGALIGQSEPAPGGNIAAININDSSVAGRALLTAATVNDHQGLLGIAPVVASRTAMKAVDTTKVTTVILIESLRAGLFKFRAGNFTSRVAADANEGVYVKATAISAGVGCWVRETASDELWRTDWFGLPYANTDGTGTPCDSAWAAMIAVMLLDKPVGAQFAPQIFRFEARWPDVPFNLVARGTLGGGVVKQTGLRRAYNDADPWRGLMTVSTHGWTIENFYMSSGAGVTGGSAVLALLPGPGTNLGQNFINNVRVSMAVGVKGLVIDGLAAQGAGGAPKGFRSTHIVNMELFNDLHFRGAQHVTIQGFTLDGHIHFYGETNSHCDNISIDGICGGHCYFGDPAAGDPTTTDFITRVRLLGPVGGSIFNFSPNTKDITVLGGYGIICERNWEDETCIVLEDHVLEDWGSHATGGWRKEGNGDIVQWGRATIDASGSLVHMLVKPVTAAIHSVELTPLLNPAGGSLYAAHYHTPLLDRVTFEGRIQTGATTAVSSMVVAYVIRGQ